MEETTFDQRRIPHFETLFTLSNGYAGLRGSIEVSPGLGDPGFYAAGVFGSVGPGENEIVNLPCWLGIEANMDGFDFDLRKGHVLEYRRALDMRKGLLYTRIVWRDDAKRRLRWESWRLMHMQQKHTAWVWGAITPLDCSGTLQLGATLDAWLTKHGSSSGATHVGDVRVGAVAGGGTSMEATVNSTALRVAMASELRVAGDTKTRVVADDDRITERLSVPARRNTPVYFERRVAFFTSRDGADPLAAAGGELRRMRKRSVASAVRQHVEAWRRTWDAADIAVDGDPRAQKGIRFNLFHLASLANPADDLVSIGAKGLHGNGYRGLVFWDTEIYMLPFLLYTNPAAARALLMYRHHFLADARANAAELGHAGARFPWNSSFTGRERLWRGWQEHVSPDIALAVDAYVAATGDKSFYLSCGARLIIETALYWPSRVERDAASGAYALRRLTGPDEIHTGIDNNAFTNHLVRWHMRRALQAVRDLQADGRWEPIAKELELAEPDLVVWEDIANRLVDTYAPDKGFHEQFEGYFKLREKAIDRSMTKMEYTGPVQHSFKPTKVAQQADTVLMYHLFKRDFPADVRRAGFKYYEPRCSHTSTLSRCIFSAVAAQAGLQAEAYRLFVESLETDTGPTAECDSGIHAACLGGNWQAVVNGFAGFSVEAGVPCFAPRLPARWRRLAFTLRWRKADIRVTVLRRAVRLSLSRGQLTVRVADKPVRIGPAPVTVRLG
jgi:trehalose/maltose hydrolase-like predicted phosphorylase